MRIGEIAAEAAVPAKTIRFWEQEGLLPAPDRTDSGYRAYQPEILERLAFIRYAQAAGFTLDQIRQVLEIGDSGEAACEHVRCLLAERLAEVEARIAELSRTRGQLLALARRADAQDPADCQGYCKILTV
jgi:MerR family transcriptional regulator, copper efflux regulator